MARFHKFSQNQAAVVLVMLLTCPQRPQRNGTQLVAARVTELQISHSQSLKLKHQPRGCQIQKASELSANRKQN